MKKNKLSRLNKILEMPSEITSQIPRVTNLGFKKMMIENLLKILYLIAALFITLGSFALISTSLIAFLMTLVFGNIAARVVYELFLVTLVICRNTTDINKKLGNKEVTKKEEEK